MRPPKAERQPPLFRRDRLAMLLALVTVACLGSAFLLFRDTQFLMPGPLASAHGAIENCSTCHTKSGSGKLSWIRGLVAGDPLGDSKVVHLPQNAGHGLQPARRFDRGAEGDHRSADESCCGDARAAMGAHAERRLSDARRGGRRSAQLRDLPPGASRCRLQSEQDLQREMQFLPRCKVRQLRRPSSEIRELSVQAAHADHLRPCRSFHQALPGSGRRRIRQSAFPTRARPVTTATRTSESWPWRRSS